MVLKNQLLLVLEKCASPQKKDVDLIFLEIKTVLFVIFQLRAVFGLQTLGPDIPTSQIKIIGVPCPVIEKSMAKSRVPNFG